MKKIINGKFHNTRAAGKPRTRWEGIQKDALQILRIQGWKRQDGDREEWRHLLKEARAQ
jgi:hypothetical protein